MALPIPLLLLAGALLFGAKKKKKPSKPKIEPLHVELAKPPVRPLHATKAIPTTKETGKPWARCKPPAGSPKGTYAAFGEGGRCMVFWNERIAKIVKDRLMEEYEKSSNKSQICARDTLIEEGYGNWIPNQHREVLVIRVIQEIWPQIPRSLLPPREGRTTYFVSMIWQLSMGWFASQVCNLNRVT